MGLRRYSFDVDGDLLDEETVDAAGARRVYSTSCFEYRNNAVALAAAGA